MAKRGLGRGLDALIGSAAAGEGTRLEEVRITDIHPNPRQPRKSFDQQSIEEMARSIEAFGVIQPVIVRALGTEYELIAGERRLRAAGEAGLESIPAIIKESTETASLEMALIENLHRDDLNSIEEAAAYQQLLDDFGITHEELSRRVGKSRTAITNTIRLLQLPPLIQKGIIDRELSAGHARALLGLQDNLRAQEQLARRVIKEGLSVRETEDLVKNTEIASSPRTKEAPQLPAEVVATIRRLEELFDTRVKGVLGKRKGRIVIEFKGLRDLARIVEIMNAPPELPAELIPAETPINSVHTENTPRE